MGGVAFWAHVGGFVTGFLVAKVFQVFEKNEYEVDDIINF
jgi:membrane associated rhomboid family serine protease